MQQRVPMTKTGAEKLKAELEHLKRVERPRIVKAIAEARAHGDLKENAEYHAAKDQQGLSEARINDIEAKLAHAQVIDSATIAEKHKVVFSALVDLVNLNDNTEVHYQIVGEDEADIKEQKIAITSPVARALIGKEVGDVVGVKTPQGIIEYEIVNIQYDM